MPASSSGVPKPRKPRPSRAKGLRTTTGCLTCRKRRVKCDELRPRCATCSKSDRECLYAPATDSPANPKTSQAGSVRTSTPPPQVDASATSSSPTVPKKSVTVDIDSHLLTNSPELLFDSPQTNVASVPSPNSAPLEWYDLLAEDAINNIHKYNLNLDIDRTCLSRRQSPAPEAEAIDPLLQSPRQEQEAAPPPQEQWNCPENIHLTDDELVLFHHYVNVIGPILDLYDSSRQLTTILPKLAVRNVGVLKSLLAVAARHMALVGEPHLHQLHLSERRLGSNVSDTNKFPNSLLQVATQYYYETLHYLSQNLLYPSYSKSREIIATALLISTYEMFDASGQYSNGAWERHLRGIFWIQRSQNNNGECNDPLRRAAWWCWIRQDTWVAFREGRRVLTIWRPTKRLMDLSADELCLRILYICGRCVDFAANEKKYDIIARIDQGGKLLQALEDWHHALPPSFQPIYKVQLPEPGNLFAPIWIHPPSYAAAVQTFHFARIVVLINQPSMGGMDDFRIRQRFLDESVEAICGIAMMHLGKELSSSFADFQALYAAGLCVQNPIKQTAILHLLEKTLDITKFPPKVLLSDLSNYWRAET
ncbi:Nn.00g084580.m01.CDS01 [Neocucurbitaria sp. VM-36]